MTAIIIPKKNNKRPKSKYYAPTAEEINFDYPDEVDSGNGIDPTTSKGNVANEIAQNTSMDPMNFIVDRGKNLAEDRLLNDFSYDIEDQADKDRAYSTQSRLIADEIKANRLNKDQLRNIEDNKSAIRAIGNIMSAQSNKMHINGQTYDVGPNWQEVYKKSTENNLETADAPKRMSEYLGNAAKEDLSLKGITSTQDRLNLKARGEDISKYGEASKRKTELADMRDSADPASMKSKSAANSFNSVINSKIAALESGSETRDRYRNLLPAYKKFAELGEGSSYNQIQKLLESVKAVDKETFDKVDQDIKEKGYAFVAAKLGMGQNDKEFEKRDKLGKIAEEFEKTKSVISGYDRLIQLANDPEVKKGFGQSLNTKIKDWTGSLTPKQSEFRYLMYKLSTPEQHAMYAGSVTGGEMAQRNNWLPTQDDSLASLLPKLSGLKSTNVRGLHAGVQRHYNLATGKDYNKELGIDTSDVGSLYENLNNYSPYSIPIKNYGQKNNVTASVKKVVSGKIATPEMLEKYMNAHPGSTMEDAKAKAREAKYIIQE